MKPELLVCRAGELSTAPRGAMGGADQADLPDKEQRRATGDLAGGPLAHYLSGCRCCPELERDSLFNSTGACEWMVVMRMEPVGMVGCGWSATRYAPTAPVDGRLSRAPVVIASGRVWARSPLPLVRRCHCLFDRRVLVGKALIPEH